MEKYSPVLKHLTKGRPKSFSKRRPSKEFLHIAQTEIDSSGRGCGAPLPAVDNQGQQPQKMLKLPPPPVAQKPSRSPESLRYEERVVPTSFVDEMRSENASTVAARKIPPAVPRRVQFTPEQYNTQHPPNKYPASPTDGESEAADSSSELQLSFSERLKAFQEATEIDTSYVSPFATQTSPRSPIGSPKVDTATNTSSNVQSMKSPPLYSAPYLKRPNSGSTQLATLRSMLHFDGLENSNDDVKRSIVPVSQIEPLEPIGIPSVFDQFRNGSGMHDLMNTYSDTSAKPFRNTSNDHEKRNISSAAVVSSCSSLEYEKPGLTSTPCTETACTNDSVPVDQFDKDSLIDETVSTQKLKHDTNCNKHLEISDNIQNSFGNSRGSGSSSSNTVPFSTFLEDRTEILEIEDQKRDYCKNNEKIIKDKDSSPLHLHAPPPPDFASDESSSADDSDFLDPPSQYCDRTQTTDFNDDATDMDGNIATKDRNVMCDLSANKSAPGAKSSVIDDSDGLTKAPSWSSFMGDSDDEKKSSDKVNLDELILKKTKSVHHGESTTTAVTRHRYSQENDSTVDVIEDPNATKIIGDRLVDVPINEWDCDDVGDWLELVGVGHLRSNFQEKNVTGQELLDIDMDLFDSVNVTSTEDREVILAEIYSFKTGEENPEMSVLDSLDTASGSDRDKMYALLEALRAPGGEQLVSSYQPSCSSSGEQKAKPTQPPRPKRPASLPPDLSMQNIKTTNTSKTAAKEKVRRNESVDGMKSGKVQPKESLKKNASFDGTHPDTSQDEPKLESKGSGKRKRFIKEALSFRRKGSSRISISKIFRNNSKTSLNMKQPEVKVADGSEGIIRIYITETDYTSLSVSPSMTSSEVIQCLSGRLSGLSDPRCYRLEHIISSSAKKKAFETILSLSDDDLPLKSQMECSSKEASKFLLKHSSDGQIKISLDNNDEENVNVHVTKQTTCKDVIEVLMNRNVLGPTMLSSGYSLAVVKKGEIIKVQDDMCILKVPGAMAKSHLFKLLATVPDIDQRPERSPDCSVDGVDGDAGNQSQDKSNVNETITSLQHQLQLLSKENQKYTENIRSLQQRLSSKHKELEVLNGKVEELTGQVTATENGRSKLQKQQKLLQESESERERNSKQIKELERQLEGASQELAQVKLSLESRVNGGDEGLRGHAEDLQQVLTEKDAKLLESEMALQAKEKDSLEIRRKLDDEERLRKRLESAKEDVEEQMKEYEEKIKTLEGLVEKKDKSLQTWHTKQGSAEEMSRREFTSLRNKLQEKDDKILALQNKLESNSLDLRSKVDTLQSMITKKEVAMKEREFNLMQECEELKVQLNHSKQQFGDLNNRLKQNESRSANGEAEYQSRLLQLEALLAEKSESEASLRGRLGEAETDLLSQANTINRTMQDKEAMIRRLESNVAKLEAGQRENLRKFERFMTEKDKILKQSKLDYETEIQELRNRLKTSEDGLSVRDRQLREVKRASIAFKEKLEGQLRNVEEQSSQHKFLLERLLTFVSSKSPNLVEEFEESFRTTSTTHQTAPARPALPSLSTDDWC